jgi:hypothetical protein
LLRYLPAYYPPAEQFAYEEATMIVHREWIKAKPGRREEVAELALSELAAQREHGRFTRPFRVYTPRISGQPGRQVVIEWEFEDLAEFDDTWAEWFALPTTPAFLDKWNEAVEQRSAIDEIWNLHTP